VVTSFLGHFYHKARGAFDKRFTALFNGPAYLRQTLENLGGTFIKFGQLLAMRPDILPHTYILELSKLLDHVRPFDGSVAAQIVERELGKPVVGAWQE
jgi:ubiquinone biosynthesis protein